MPKRGRTNPLALAVLACLQEQPMHPYEVAQTLRLRHKDESIKLNFGSLYSVVEGLEKRSLIVAREAEREGRRPERTVYEITADGTTELFEWLTELIVEPEKEYLRFEAGLSLLGHLRPDDAARLLRQRADRLAALLDDRRTRRDVVVKSLGLPRIHLIEDEYVDALLGAELAFVEALAADIEHGTLDGIETWRGYHAPKRRRTT